MTEPRPTLYVRYPVGFRMVKDMLAYRGIYVTNETVHEWAEKFGRSHTNAIHRRLFRIDGQ